MKNIILTAAALLAITGISTVKASEIKAPLAITIKMDSTLKVHQDSTQKVPVKLEELPAPVATTLKADAYKDWKATDAFLVTAADKSQYYLINVAKNTEKAFIKINKDGVVVQ
ncbi:hypothetical protein HDE68_000066 [Pedobacter cryoconitis]|uniref:PepSY-like beta-lactamase-inhibitor n=1 Tax=Pedobacter cryoconitis TaxID=188932 RepID=A0A7W8ZHQ7_9SPHI|nr:hypothetical protein [Pedobacter cryoconitis]MBB5634181.1 hypothetical protein [Pedobacter cryoconitis]